MTNERDTKQPPGENHSPSNAQIEEKDKVNFGNFNVKKNPSRKTVSDVFSKLESGAAKPESDGNAGDD